MTLKAVLFISPKNLYLKFLFIIIVLYFYFQVWKVNNNESLFYDYVQFTASDAFLLYYWYSVDFFWLYWIFVARCRLSLVSVSWDHSPVAVHQLLIVVASVVRENGFRSTVSGVVPRDLAALWHVGSSRTRDPTCVSCIGRWILNYWTTREVLDF